MKELSDDLVERAKEVANEGDGRKERREDEWAVPSEVRRRKVEQVEGLLERESALVDAVQMRLERLKVGLVA